MNNSNVTYNRDDFIACNWTYDVLPEKHYGYSSIMQSLDKSSKEKLELGFEKQSRVLSLLSRSASMMMAPESLNEPLKPFFQDYQAGKRSPLPEDFTADELSFFAEILNDIDEHQLKSRLADLLWLCNEPRDPNHAKTAIDLYISNDINSETWNRGENKCWERAARLCLQLRDYERLDCIKNKLFSSFNLEHSNSKFMTLWIASLMDKLNIDSDFREDIARVLFTKGNELLGIGDFNSARSYFELSSKKFKQSNDEKAWLDSLDLFASCFEQEADSRSSGSNMVANSFYENAIQAYRRIPTKHRDDYGVNDKISGIREKVTQSGKESLGEMGLLQTPGIDISESIEAAKAHVSGKASLEEGLMFFAGLYPGPNLSSLQTSAQETLQSSFLSSMFGSTQLSSDGRVIGKTPPMNLNADEEDPSNQAVLNRQVQQHFGIETQLIVEGKILPALRQLVLEHRATKELLNALCMHSSIVPDNRENLLSYALWLGFEHDFGSAIHLLCPQVEHIVRIKLKEAGAHTSNIDRDGIENENGLSTLLELPEASEVFGTDLCFEFKSIFTDSLGSNLRNEVAHGLLDDNSSFSISTIYAWWMVIRLVVHSLVEENSSRKKEESSNSSCVQNT
jgi:tetratricopeptide (TPR) repeat protein